MMLLCNVTIYGNAERKNILISDGVIKSITDEGRPLPENKDGKAFHLNGAVAFPGFINSHDHLDFNLYPQLGRGPYQNYTEWGHDIHQVYAGEIAAVKRVPEPLRIKWGLYKNLLNGFTTVVNHGKKISISNDIVNVFQDCNSLHSVSFEKNWKWKLNNPFYRIKPYVIHAGEGADEKSGNEIGRLVQSNYLGKKIIAVHGVAMSEKQAGSFAGLVWCPASNYFLLGKTAAIHRLADKTAIVFGTDSTLTSPRSFKEHVRAALSSGLVNEPTLVKMLTETPASLWGMNGIGEITAGKMADMVVLNGSDLSRSEILLLLKKGEPVMMNETVLTDKDSVSLQNYTRIKMERNILVVKGDIKLLVKDILHYYPAANIPFELL